ncbi:uncharacterized protein LOC106142918 [Amyelois transitella]|uniref:uncharacterized protein LOC106142918 n=1 Tax=Amyelois transitella TaxID=680683 RepID=UPI00067B5EE5|nr:uncharacterized protein LOC106142918 [Amyelois transitella]
MSQNAVLFIMLVILITSSNGTPLNFKNVEMHPNCRNSTYCFERGADYPSALIEELVNKTDVIKIDGATTEQRGTTDHSIVTPCELNYSLEPIYQVKDINNKVRYVVQATRFQQILKVEWCRNKGEITEDKGEYLKIDKLREDSYSAYCVESYSNYRFLVLAEDGNGFESVKALGVPICCRCEIHPMGKIIKF